MPSDPLAFCDSNYRSFFGNRCHRRSMGFSNNERSGMYTHAEKLHAIRNELRRQDAELAQFEAAMKTLEGATLCVASDVLDTLSAPITQPACAMPLGTRV